MRPKIVRIAKTLLQKICLNSLFWMYWAASTWAPTFSSIKWHFDLFYSSLLQNLSKSDSFVFRVRVGWNKNETFCRLLSKYFPRWRCKWESTTGHKMATKAQMVKKLPISSMNSGLFLFSFLSQNLTHWEKKSRKSNINWIHERWWLLEPTKDEFLDFFHFWTSIWGNVRLGPSP